jgi:hypothetical protein
MNDKRASIKKKPAVAYFKVRILPTPSVSRDGGKRRDEASNKIADLHG